MWWFSIRLLAGGIHQRRSVFNESLKFIFLDKTL
jgi:hypothetical protein